MVDQRSTVRERRSVEEGPDKNESVVTSIMLVRVSARVLKEATIRAGELERQLSEIRDGSTSEAREMRSFLLGDAWKKKVEVDPDLRLVMPSFRFVRVPDVAARKYPDVAFAVNFLSPWLSAHGVAKEPDWSRLHGFLRSVKRDERMTLYRFQPVEQSSELGQEIGDAIANVRAPVADFRASRPRHESFAKTFDGAKSAAFGAGVFGEYSAGFLYRADVEPLFDVESFSRSLVGASERVFGRVPDVFDPIDTYGTREEEVIARPPTGSLEFGKDVLAIKHEGQFVTAEELAGDEKIERIERRSADGPRVVLLKSTIKTIVEYLSDELKHVGSSKRMKGYSEKDVTWMSTGARFKGESAHQATVVSRSSRDVPDEVLSVAMGRDVFLYSWR